MEEQKDESKPDGGPEDRNMESWIDIKQETYHLTNEQIRQLIEVSLFGDAYRLFDQRQLNSRFEEFSIHIQSNSDEYDIKPSLFRDPKESLIKREKFKHLTIDQKLYVYGSYKVGELMVDIRQRTGISISTIKRIVKDSDTKINRKQLYTKVRWRRVIESQPIKYWIADYILKQTGCFTAEHVKTHIMNKYRVAIPFQQIRHHLKQVHNLSYKMGNLRPALLYTERIRLLKDYFV